MTTTVDPNAIQARARDVYPAGLERFAAVVAVA
jgi:hypothetical protein